MSNRLASNPTCPGCNMTIDGYTPAEGEKQEPEDGDLSVCSYCYTALEFVTDPDTGLITLVLADDLDEEQQSVINTVIEQLKRAKERRFH